MRVVVVGAGLAGLAATCRLADDGHEVILVERSRLIGGKATSFVVDGVEVDNGQHVHLGCCTEYLDFVESLGMGRSLWTQPRFEVTVLRRGRAPARLRASRGLPPSLSLLPSFARYGPLGLAAKAQVARALRRSAETPADGESFASWLQRHGQGRAAIDGFWELFVVPALNARLDEVSATDALFVVRTAFAGDPDAARIGWSRVPLAHIAGTAAARAGSVRLRTGVVSLLDRGGEVRGVRTSDGEEILGDAVVLAVPPARVGAILGDPPAYGVTGLDRFASRAIVDVHLWFGTEAGLGFAALIGSPVQWVFEKQPGYLCCSLSAADRVVGWPEADLVELCQAEVRAAWPRLRNATLVRGAATRDPDATFVPAPGLRRPGAATSRPNLVIAGAWTETGWPATMESAVRSGREAAASLRGSGSPRRSTSRPSVADVLQRERMTGAVRGVASAVQAATDHLLGLQDQAGWWSGELETNVTMTAEHVLLLAFLGVPHDRIRDEAMRHLLGCQREDGSWALYHDAPADLSTTVEAYVALRVLGLDPGAPELRAALRVILEQGGVAHARVFTKIWLALFGAYPWEGVPSMPPELVWLPPSVPLNLYDFACWARGTIAPLLIVISRRPRRPLPFSLSELVLPGTEWRLRRVEASGPFAWADRLQKQYDRLRFHPGRDASRRRLVGWIRERQEADGGWGGIQPPWVYSLIALHLEGMPLEHPVMRRGLAGLDRFALDDGEGWRLQACMSPVWDTALAVLALRRAGVLADATPVRRAVGWLVGEQILGGGDWQVRCPPGVEGGGWAFEFDNDIYPDVDDTAVVVLALLQAEQTAEVREAVRRARRWVEAMRSSNGAWAAFDRDNVRQVVYALPFADFGAMLDPPSEDVTAHAVEMLGALGVRPDATVMAAAIDYLRTAQRPDGSWFGRWGVNHVYGTWCVVSALTSLRSDQAGVARAVAWTERAQNRDGGWGESCMSYRDASFAGVGASTPSQTAWAMLTLQAGGAAHGAAAHAGVGHLVERQSGGTWDEPEHTGTGFPGDFYINYHLYRHVFPLMALAEYASTDA